MRETAKALARGLAFMGALPFLLSYAIKRPLMGANTALEGSSQSLGNLPGLVGDYIRRAFFSQVLAHMAPTAVVQYGTLFSQAGARLDDNVYVGPRCHLGLVHLERDVLLAAGVHVPSGALTHGSADLDKPIREQPGARTLVRIGEGTWVGSAAVVLADVGKHAIIAAGAVVTKPIPDYAVAAGVPARVIKDRRMQANPGIASDRDATPTGATSHHNR